MKSSEKLIKAEYNKRYYEKKKDEIASKLYAKEPCTRCGRILSHQNIRKHMETRYCKDRSGKVSSEREMEILKEKIKVLEDKLA